MNTRITYVAMDTHKKQHRVAMINQQTGEIKEFTVNNLAKDITKMVRKIKKQTSGRIHFCYEAGVCGFALKRQIDKLGCRCSVIAPSLVPIRPGDRIKTDRRDAKKLLGQFVAGQLTEVYPPNEQQEAARDLTRCRESALQNLQRIRHQLLKFLTRHGYIYKDGSHWTEKHLQWLRSLEFDLLDLREVFEIYYAELQHCVQRLKSLDRQVEQLAKRPEYSQMVDLLCCFQGIKTLTAITILTEIFEFGRFDCPRALMSYLGLVPSEFSSAEKRHPGGITKTGNRRVRRLLTESAWHYRHRPKVSGALKRRRHGQPDWAVNIADQAMGRLSRRYRRLLARGKMSCKVVVAVARELVGFIWAMLREFEIRKKYRVT
jgi:transposase